MKEIGKISYQESGIFPKLYCDYSKEKKELSPFYNHFPNKANFQKQIEDRKKYPIDRKLLTDRLKNQYKDLDLNEKLVANLEDLNQENCFCITTGHQLNLFSGPLFFHYKIQSTIRICKDLKEEYPEYRFIPVYWMATEDHDFEEVNHLWVDSNKVEWKRKDGGPVGRFDLEGMDKVFADLGPASNYLKGNFKGNNWSEAHRSLVHSWYGDQGLLILDADDKELKKSFSPWIEKELISGSLHSEIEKTSERLGDLHYRVQVNPREINLFYVLDNYRERIVKKQNGQYEAGSDYSWDEEGIKKELQNNPERFSPNVVLRPVYQEHILPNLAYVGGPGEISYWLQLKDAFIDSEVSFPILFPRISVTLLQEKHNDWLKELNLDPADIFLPIRDLELNWIKHSMGEEFSLKEEFKALEDLESQLSQRAKMVDKGLIKYVGARTREMEKVLEAISKKLRKSLEKNESTNLSRLDKVKNFGFPDSSPQERRENYLSFFPPELGPLKNVGEMVDPWDLSIKIIGI